MNKSFSQTVNRILIIDARYGYEFKGGHIRGAVNIPSEVSLFDNLTLFDNQTN